MRRTLVLLVLVLTILALMSVLAGGVGAREIRVIGCDSLLNWPCPGPAL